MPDPSGNLLPPGVEDGSAMLEPAAAGVPGKNGMIKVPKGGPAEMEVAVSMGIFNARTATCCTCCTSCCVLTCPAVEDGLGFVGVGQNLAATMTAEDCCGFLEDFTDAATWSDNNGAVLASQGAGAFNALGVGSATLTAQAYLIAGSGTCNGKCHSTLVAPTAPAEATQCGDPPGSAVRDSGGFTEDGAPTDRGALIAEYQEFGVQDDSACSPSDSTCIADSPLFTPSCSDFTDNVSLGGPYYQLGTLKGSDVYEWALIQYPLVEPAGNNVGLNAWIVAITAKGYSLPPFNSGYRTPGYNSTLTGAAANSRHLFGDAADLQSTTCTVWDDFDNAVIASAAPSYVEPQGQNGSGCGHVHADWRNDDPGGNFQH